MKKFMSIVVLVVMMFEILSSFALAGNAHVDGDGTAIGADFNSTNNNNNTNNINNNNNLRQDQNQTQFQQQQIYNQNDLRNYNNNDLRNYNNNDLRNNVAVGGQANKQVVKITNPREFLALTNFGSFVNSGVSASAGQWLNYHPSIFTMITWERASKMKRHFQLSDILPWNWFSSNVSVSLHRDPFPENTQGIYLAQYWPEEESYVGDEVIADLFIVGEASVTRGIGLGLAAAECMSVGSPRMALRVRNMKDGVTKGRSLGLSGAAAKVEEETGVTFVGGGMIGTNRTKVETRMDFEVMCLNAGSILPPSNALLKSEKPKAEVTAPEQSEDGYYERPAETARPVEQPKKVCDADKIRNRIAQLEKEVAACKRFCFNNLKLRTALGDANIALYQCTGDKQYLNSAIKHYQIAERNHKHGYDIRAHQQEADSVLARAYFNWAGCIRELDGRDAAMRFASQKKLERIPRGFAVTR